MVDLPGGTVTRGDVDERRSDVHVGIVGPRVVLWNVFERTRCFVVDGDVDRRRSGATTVVGPNGVRGGRCLQGRWDTPNRNCHGRSKRGRLVGLVKSPTR